MEPDKNGGHNGPGPAPAKPDPQERQYLLQPGVLYVWVSLVIKSVQRLLSAGVGVQYLYTVQKKILIKWKKRFL